MLQQKLSNWGIQLSNTSLSLDVHSATYSAIWREEPETVKCRGAFLWSRELPANEVWCWFNLFIYQARLFSLVNKQAGAGSDNTAFHELYEKHFILANF